MRIILSYKGKNYKLLNFFVDKKDNSFYFHFYRKQGELPREPDVPLNMKEDKTIDFTKYHVSNFFTNKVSFHESGLIHYTDDKGGRLKKGGGVPFSEIKSTLEFFVVVPRNPVEMVELKGATDPRRDWHIAIQYHEAFLFRFFLHKIGTPIAIELPGNILEDGCVVFRYDDKDFELLIGMTKVFKAEGVETVKWPPFTLMLMRLKGN